MNATATPEPQAPRALQASVKGCERGYGCGVGKTVRMRMLFEGAEKMSPISSVMMAILLTLRGGMMFRQELWFMVG